MAITPTSQRVFQQVLRQATDLLEPATEQIPTMEARRELLSYKQLKELVLHHNSPFVGVVPDAFTNATQASNEEIVAGINWLATTLLKPNGLQQLKPSVFKSVYGTFIDPKNPVKRLFQKNLIRIKELDSGVAGRVYQLQVNGQDFALKVFTSRSSMDAYRETATGMHYTQGMETSTMSDLFIANPAHPTAKWTLMEFMPDEFNMAERAGKPMKDKLSDNNPKNYKGPVRVDHGGVVTKEGEGYMAPDEFKRFSRLKAPAGHKRSASNISNISVQRPPNLAISEADWDAFEEMLDNLPLNTLRTMGRWGKTAQAGRGQNKAEARTPLSDLSSQSSRLNSKTNTRGYNTPSKRPLESIQHRFDDMQLAAAFARDKRRKNSEKAATEIYKLYEDA